MSDELISVLELLTVQLVENMQKIRVLIIDDHPAIMQGLQTFIEINPDIEVVDSAKDGLAGLEKLRHVDVDIIVLDLEMPKLNGIDAIRLYLKEKPEVGIVVFTGHKNDVYVHQALEAGARGYVLKGNSISQVIDAVREVQRGGFWLSPELNQGIIATFVRNSTQIPHVLDGFKSLSKREQQVFRLLAKGKPTSEVAEILFISPKTVAKHRVAIKHKLNLKNVVEMANYAVQIGLLQLDMEIPGNYATLSE